MIEFKQAGAKRALNTGDIFNFYTTHKCILIHGDIRYTLLSNTNTDVATWSSYSGGPADFIDRYGETLRTIR